MRSFVTVAAGLLMSLGGCSAGDETRGPWTLEAGELAFTSIQDRRADIYLKFYPAAGESTAVNLTDAEGGDHWVSWAPEGDRFAFQTLRDGNREVYVMDASGENVRNLTQDPAEDMLPDWSPEGDRIAFFSTRGHERGPNGEFVGDIYVMNPRGGGIRKVTTTPLESSYGPGWSPDGRSILTVRRFDGNPELVRVDVDTGAETRLTETAGAEGSASYSPDGSRIAFYSEGEEASPILVMDADGSNLVTLVSEGRNYYPTWSPDGEWISYTALGHGEQYDILAIRSDGREGPLALVATTADERKGVWRP